MERERRFRKSKNSNLKEPQAEENTSLKPKLKHRTRKKSFLQLLSLKKLKFTNNLRGKIITGISLLVIFILLIVINTYKSNNFQINDLKFVNISSIYPIISKHLNEKNYFSISPKKLSEDIKSKHPLILDADVNKTLFRGLIIDIKEYTPTSIIKLQSKKQLYFTKENKFIDYQSIDKSLLILNYSGEETFLDNSKTLIPKAVEFIEEINKINIVGAYTFDNFGNLSILSLDNKSIKVDLNERYLSIDEQIKVFQNALEINTFQEIDLRFKDLIIRRK